MKKLAKVYEYLIYILPAVLFFSYYPIFSIGATGSMNLEFSLPLVWLALFDLVALILMFYKIKFGKKYQGITDRKFFMFSWLPFLATLSIFWSQNPLRGILTAGILWLVFLAIFALIFLTKIFVTDFSKTKIIKCFMVSSCIICVWCFVQCILNVAGVGRDVTLLCAGCTVQSFGFPHPNGFAIEPQFMGNLLLAPTLYVLYQFVKKRSTKNTILLAFFSATLFLTFSRGAIYAFAVAVIAMLIMEIMKTKKAAPLKSLLVIIAAFIFTLNLQGIFSALSYTDDDYFSGVNKVISQLSLGLIDFKRSEAPEESDIDYLKEAPVNESIDPGKSEFDGYVEESTAVRMQLTRAALEVWKEDPKTMLIGVGLGGAGEALFEHNKTGSKKEIVQNEYASILLELGLVGAILLIVIFILTFLAIKQSPNSGLLLPLLLAYAVTLLFFSGLPNALHIYLIPALFLLIAERPGTKIAKK